MNILPLVRTVLTLLHSEGPKLYTILAFLSAIGLKTCNFYVLQSLTIFVINNDSKLSSLLTYLVWYLFSRHHVQSDYEEN